MRSMTGGVRHMLECLATPSGASRHHPQNLGMDMANADSGRKAPLSSLWLKAPSPKQQTTSSVPFRN